MAQENKEQDTNTKFTYQEFCKMMRRFTREQDKKEHKQSHLGYIPMREFRKLKPRNQVKGK